MLGGDEPDLSIPINFPDTPETFVIMLVIFGVITSMIGSGLVGLGRKWKIFWGPFLTFTIVVALALVWARDQG